MCEYIYLYVFYLCLIIYHFICFFKIEFMNRWIKTFKAKVQLILYLLMRIMQLWKGSYTKEFFFLQNDKQSIYTVHLSIWLSSHQISNTMSCAAQNNSRPKTMSRAKRWNADVENLFRFQQAGYRDEFEYIQVKHGALVNVKKSISSLIFN